MPVAMNATVTGRTGIGQLITAAGITGITRFEIDILKSTLTLFWTNASGQHTTCLDFVLTTTLTDSIAALVNTVVISGS